MIRFILENAIDASELITDPVITSDNVIDNVKKISRSKYVRSDNIDSDFTIHGNAAESADISAMVLAKHNFSENVNYQLILYPDYDQGGTPLYDSGILTVTAEEAATDMYEWGEFNWGAIVWEEDKKDSDNRQFYDLVLWKEDSVISNVKSFSIIIGFPESSNDAIFFDDTSIYFDDTSTYWSQEYIGEILIAGVTNISPSGGTLTGFSNLLSQERFRSVYYTGLRQNPNRYDVPVQGTEVVQINIPYYEIGRIYLGEYIEPTYNISLGHSISWKENTKQYRPSSGTLRSDYTTSNRSMTFSLNTIPSPDSADLHKKLISKGLRDDLYISIFPGDADKEIDYSSLVKFTKIPKYTEFINSYYKSKFTIEEV